MQNIESSDLKHILHSKRANIFYLEYCCVRQKDGRVVYLTETHKENLYYNIPIANTTVMLLGNGTSITQAAAKMLSQAGVLYGFCGGGGTPLYSGREVEWLTPQSEYRPTEYLQAWVGFWFDEQKRLAAGKTIQQARISYLQKVWSKDKELKLAGFDPQSEAIQKALTIFTERNDQVTTNKDLLLAEAQLTKALYKYAATSTGNSRFVRQHQSTDKANGFLDHGNYLAYGFAACCLWVLGIPHGFAVMHGKTRQGALVFDIADLIKDAIVLPWAFVCAKEGFSRQHFRQQILHSFIQHKALDYMFDTVKEIAFQFTNKPVEEVLLT